MHNCPPPGQPKEDFRFIHEVNWGDFLNKLYTYHPSGNWRDLVPGNEDFDTENESEYYDVVVQLW